MWLRTEERLEKIEGFRIELCSQDSIWEVLVSTKHFLRTIYKGTKEECNNYIDNIIERLTYSEKRIILYI